MSAAARVSLLALCLIAVLPFCIPAQAQQTSSSPGSAKIDQIIKLLDDPDVRALLATRQSTTAASMPHSSASSFAFWLDDARDHLRTVAEAVPLVPGELSKVAATVMANPDEQSRIGVLYSVLLLLSIGFCAEFGFALVVERLHVHWSANAPMAHSSSLHRFGRVLFASLAPLVIFGAVTIGTVAVSNWPPTLGQIMLPTWVGLIGTRAIIRLSDVILLPDTSRAHRGQDRLLPMSDAAARFWSIRVAVFTLLFFVSWNADAIMTASHMIPAVRMLGLDVVSIALLAVAVETVWRRPRPTEHHPRHGMLEWMLTFWLCSIWVTTLAGLPLATLLGLYIVVLPAILRIAGSVVRRAFQPLDGAPARSHVYQVLAERGSRAAIIAIAILWPALILRGNAATSTQGADASVFVPGLLNGIVILLAADIVWEIAKAAIDHRLGLFHADGASEDEIAHNSRELTLLPILRNFLAVLIAVLAVMMVLSAVGIEVAPLIAGAGIFGIAIGFGSQTLVKDVISGIFYMTDDAFRVGEYIQSGSYKGTVESFSLRSVRLRHHRGPIFTVPFGSLGAVENMSRDWVVDKFLISVSYQTDVAVVKKLVKGVGVELLEDPELGPMIIETVKMKGVEQFGDYGINLSFGMMTKPGQQSMVRRRALVMIREAFSNNGVEFASPTVNVGRDAKVGDNAVLLDETPDR